MDKDELKTLHRAAVLILLTQIKSQWHVLFIRRADRDGDLHSGQVAFPGGKYEYQDHNLEMTAIRETQEEIGLHPDNIQIIGQLSSHHTVTKFKIYPFAGVIPWPVSLSPQLSEVARIFTIPLVWLQDSNNYSYKKHPLQKSRKSPIIFFDQYDGEILWGASARITLSFLEAINRGELAFR